MSTSFRRLGPFHDMCMMYIDGYMYEMQVDRLRESLIQNLLISWPVMEYGNMDTLMERNAFVTAERIRHGTYSTSKDSVPAHLMFMMRLFNDLCTLIHGRQHDHLLQKKKNLKKKGYWYFQRNYDEANEAFPTWHLYYVWSLLRGDILLVVKDDVWQPQYVSRDPQVVQSPIVTGVPRNSVVNPLLQLNRQGAPCIHVYTIYSINIMSTHYLYKRFLWNFDRRISKF